METKQPPRLTKEDYQLQPHAPVQVLHGIHPGTIPLHWHEFYELSYVVSGKGEHRLNGSSYPLSSGTIFLLTPADFHGEQGFSYTSITPEFGPANSGYMHTLPFTGAPVTDLWEVNEWMAKRISERMTS